MRDAAFILALQKPKIANLIFMDSKILNLLERTVTIPSIKVAPSEPPSAFCTFLSKGTACTEGYAGRAVYFRFTPCLYLNESESIQKSQEQEPRRSFAFSPHNGEHSTALNCLNKHPTEQELHHFKTVISFKH